MVLRSTARAVSATEASGRSFGNGVAIMAASKRAAAPTAARTHLRAAKDLRIGAIDMAFSSLNSSIIEYSILQSNDTFNAGFAVAAEIPTLCVNPKSPIRLSEMTAAEALINAPEFTVSELSSALR